MKRADGKYIDWFQRGSYITSKETGLPLYGLGMLTDIGPAERNIPLKQTIEKIENTNGSIINTLVEQNYFYPYEEDTLLTKQEKKYLKIYGRWIKQQNDCG